GAEAARTRLSLGPQHRRRAQGDDAALAERGAEPVAYPRHHRGAAASWRLGRALCPDSAAARMTPFGERLRELRAQRGLSQTQMAADLGLSAAYLSALEH